MLLTERGELRLGLIPAKGVPCLLYTSGRGRCVDLFDQGDNLFALGVAWGRSAVLPLVVPGPVSYTHLM